MRKLAVLVSFFISLTAFAQICPPSNSLSFPFTLSGSQFGGNGSPNAFGTGFVTLNPGANTATVQLQSTGLGANVTGAGLFNNGTSFLPFFGPGVNNGNNGNNGNGNGTNNGTFDQNGNFTTTVPLTQAQMNAILANPAAFNFGVSTGEFPTGAVNGTLMNNMTFGGTFSGANVVGGTGSTNGGGFFSANIVPNTTGGGSTLYYSFTPTGIGSTFTGLSLNQGGVGVTSTPFLNLSTNGGTLTNGRYTGSTQLTQAQAQSLMTNPGGFNVTANTSQFPNGAIRAQFGGGTQYELWFPVAGSVRGALGNQWTTDLRVYNPAGGAMANVNVELFPANLTTTNAGSTMNASAGSAFTIGGRNTNVMNNITGTLSPNFNGLGALRLTSDQPIVAFERIYDAAANSNNGSNGTGIAAAAQAIGGLTMCDALTRGVLPGIFGSASTSSNIGVHSNAGFFNPNPTAVTVLVNLGSAQGQPIGTQRALTLQPFQLVQMPVIAGGTAGLFNAGGDVTDAAIRFQSSAPIFAYTTVVNHASGDTHLTYAEADMSSPTVLTPSVAAITLAANQGEVLEGQVAVQNANSATVRTFAQRMVSEHTAALTQAQGLFSTLAITPATDDPTALFLQSQTQQDVSTLNSQSGTQFDRTYMQRQVAMHQAVLQMLDTTLIPSASGNTQLVSFLQQMRAEVAQHLTDAQQILASLP